MLRIKSHSLIIQKMDLTSGIVVECVYVVAALTVERVGGKLEKTETELEDPFVTP